MSTCQVDNCDSQSRTPNSKYCEKHYMRLRRRGTTERKLRESVGACLQCGSPCDTVTCSQRCATRLARGREETSRVCLWCKGQIGPDRRSDAIFCKIACSSNYKYANGNKERHLVYSANRRARNRGAEGDFTLQEWNFVVDFYNNICLSCGIDKPLTKDHIKPLFKGGSNYIENLQPLCMSCNLSKHTKTIDYRPDGGKELMMALIRLRRKTT